MPISSTATSRRRACCGPARSRGCLGSRRQSQAGEAASFAASHETCADISGSDETNKTSTTPLIKGSGTVLKPRWLMIVAFTNHEGCNDAKGILLNWYNRIWDCCCSVFCVVTCRYAIASNHRVIVDQPRRNDGGVQGSARS